MTGAVDDGTYIDQVKGGGFEGLDRSQVRAAVILHELLHALSKIPDDDPAVLRDNGAQSKANAELVRKSCFKGA